MKEWSLQGVYTTYLESGTIGIERLVKNLSLESLEELASLYLVYLVKKNERELQLSIEREASTIISPYKTPPTPSPIYTKLKKTDPYAGFEEIYQDPSLIYSGQFCDWKSAERKKFRKWMVRNGKDVEDFILRAIPHSEERIVRGDWHEDGIYGYAYDMRTVEIRNMVNSAVEWTEKRIRLELTQEFLESKFALGDGTQVSWGKATVKQHETRIDLLSKNAAANIESAGRHKSAIELIKKTNVRNLSQAKKKGISR